MILIYSLTLTYFRCHGRVPLSQCSSISVSVLSAAAAATTAYPGGLHSGEVPHSGIEQRS